MFENLTDKLERSFKILKGEGRITEIEVGFLFLFRRQAQQFGFHFGHLGPGGFRGFVAGFWQGISKIFGQDLKSAYDKEGEDPIG